VTFFVLLENYDIDEDTSTSIRSSGLNVIKAFVIGKIRSYNKIDDRGRLVRHPGLFDYRNTHRGSAIVCTVPGVTIPENTDLFDINKG